MRITMKLGLKTAYIVVALFLFPACYEIGGANLDSGVGGNQDDIVSNHLKS